MKVRLLFGISYNICIYYFYECKITSYKYDMLIYIYIYNSEFGIRTRIDI